MLTLSQDGTFAADGGCWMIKVEKIFLLLSLLIIIIVIIALLGISGGARGLGQRWTKGSGKPGSDSEGFKAFPHFLFDCWHLLLGKLEASKCVSAAFGCEHPLHYLHPVHSSNREHKS